MPVAQLGSSQQDTILLYSSTVATTLPTAAVQRPTFLWPGIEGVLESYTKHKAGRRFLTNMPFNIAE